MLLDKTAAIAPKGVKRLSQSGNNTHLWICLLVKVQCCKEQYCIGTQNVSSMNQGNWKWSNRNWPEWTWTLRESVNYNGLEWANLTQMTIISTTVGKNPLEKMVAIIVNRRIWNAVLGCNLKNDSIISVRFQGKPFSITVIQAYAPTSNAEEAEWFYEDLQDLLELTPQKDVLFIIGDWNAKVGSQETPGVTGQFRLGIQMNQDKG